MGRTMAETMRPLLGQPVVIENVTGANGTIGVGRMVRAAPDGYTVGVGNWPSLVTNGAIYNLNYDFQRDLEPVVRLPHNPYIAVVRKDFPAKDFREMIAWLKANPNKGTEGTAGLGSGQHISGVYFQKITGTQFQFVPYKAGSGQHSSRHDRRPHRLHIRIQAITSLNHVKGKGGNVKGYAVTSDKRLDAAPDIPTVDEAGAPGVYISTWYGLWVPKGTPKEAIDRLGKAAMTAMADPAVRAKLAALGQQIPTPEQQTAAALAAYQKAEIEKWLPADQGSRHQGRVRGDRPDRATPGSPTVRRHGARSCARINTAETSRRGSRSVTCAHLTNPARSQICFLSAGAERRGEALPGGDRRRRAGGRGARGRPRAARRLLRAGRDAHRAVAIPKGQNLTQRTLEHFYFWGIVDELRAARIMPPGYPIGEITAYGNLMSEYWHAPAGRETGPHDYYSQDNERLPQYRMEEVLRRKMAELAERRSRFGWSATGVEQDGERVRVIDRQGSGPDAKSGGRLCGRLRRRALHRSRAGRHRARRHRFRSAHGARGVPLARAARGAQAVSADARPIG